MRCCGLEPNWVENVPGKGYFFCGECRQEVKEELETKSAVEAALNEGLSITQDDTTGDIDYSYWSSLSTATPRERAVRAFLRKSGYVDIEKEWNKRRESLRNK